MQNSCASAIAAFAIVFAAACGDTITHIPDDFDERPVYPHECREVCSQEYGTDRACYSDDVCECLFDDDAECSPGTNPA